MSKTIVTRPAVDFVYGVPTPDCPDPAGVSYVNLDRVNCFHCGQSRPSEFVYLHPVWETREDPADPPTHIDRPSLCLCAACVRQIARLVGA